MITNEQRTAVITAIDVCEEAGYPGTAIDLRTLLGQGTTEAAPVAWRHSLTHSLHDTEDEVQLADGDESAQGLYTMDQMRDYALAFHKTRVESLDIADLKRRLERVQVRIAEHRSDPNVTAVTFSTTPEMMLKLVERIEGVESLLAASASAEPVRPSRGYVSKDAVERAKRIMSAVDIYHVRPDGGNRHALRSVIMDEIEELIAAPRPIEAPAQAVALSETRADIAADRHFINGVKLGWNFRDANDEKGFQACIEGRAKQIQDARAALSAPTSVSAENRPAQDDVRDAQRYRWAVENWFAPFDEARLDAAIASQSAKEPK